MPRWPRLGPSQQPVSEQYATKDGRNNPRDDDCQRKFAIAVDSRDVVEPHLLRRLLYLLADLLLGEVVVVAYNDN